MNSFSHVPPGFRFHPTEEELVDYYLRKKVNSRRIDLDVIKDVDLYKIEPWDLQELCRIGTEEQNEWYFFSHKDKKYPTGTRTNRATAAGFWKATGRDKAIYSKHDLIGMRKTLVFYKGRAPNGQKSDWIMHEYRLETDENGTAQEEGWVVCRVFKKRMTTMRKVNELEPGCWYDDQVPFMQDFDSPKQSSQPDHHHLPYLPYTCKKELVNHLSYQLPHHDHFLQLPLLQSPKLFESNTTSSYGVVLDMNQASTNILQSSSITQELHSIYCNNKEKAVDQVTDWRVLDKFVASQLSQEDVPNNEDDHYSNNASEVNVAGQLNKQESMVPETASTSTSSCQIELWK